MVEAKRGNDPLACDLRNRCSTNWATWPYTRFSAVLVRLNQRRAALSVSGRLREIQPRGCSGNNMLVFQAGIGPTTPRFGGKYRNWTYLRRLTATCLATKLTSQKSGALPTELLEHMAGELGADPRPIVLETIRLPLSYSPMVGADRLELSIALCYAPILAYFPEWLRPP